MQSASVNFVRAATGAGGTWAKPKIQADWWNDGYSSAATLGPGFIRDVFDRAATDTWGSTTPFLLPYSNTGGLASEQYVSAGVGYQVHGTANDIHRALITLGHSDFDIYVNATLPGSAAGGATFGAWVAGRAADINNYYGVRLELSTAGAVSLQPFKRVGGALAGLGSATPIGTHTTGATWRIHVRMSGTTMTARAWKPAVASEPTSWQTTNTDLTELTTGNQIGLLSRRETGNTDTGYTVGWSDLRATGGGIDELSGQVSSWSIQHHLDDGYPDSVTFISGVGFSEASADLTPPPAYLTDNVPQQIPEYYSPYNTDSPVYGLDRDVAPVKIEHGLITASGPELIRVFTGQMQDIPTKGGKAQLQAASATRLALSKLVQPPSFSYPSVGLNGSWPVSWALAQCGLYVSPPPRTGCRWWVPMHGSTRPFIPSTNVDLNDATFWQSPKYLAGDSVGQGRFWRPTFIAGPFLSAPDCQLTAAENRRVTQANIEFGAGTDIFSQAGNAGRLEFWIKGDATDVNNAPTGSANYTRLASLRTMADLVSGRNLHLGVNTSRQAFIYANDGAGHSITLTSTDTLPTDGAWYFVGCAYDVANKKVWLTNFNGSTRSTGWSTAVTSSLPATDDFPDSTYPNWAAHLPVAEIQFTTGAQANVDNYPTWLNSIAFTPDVVMTRSVLELVMVAETEPVEAWEFISRYAQAELAAMRTDELDRFNYLGFGYWVTDAQQVVVDVIGTGVNAETPDINADPTKIRNSVRVTYEAVEIPGTRVPAYTLSQQLTIPPGTTVFEFAFSKPVVALSDSDILYLTDDDVVAGVTVYANLDYVLLNSETDGSGTFADASTVTITKGDWHAGAAVWTFYNNSATTWYTANTQNVPSLQISGYPIANPSAFVTDSDDTSVARRGERALPISGTSAVQNVVDARRLARRLKMGLRDPTPITDTLEVFGDPRRQPGDLVTFEDPSVTRVSGQWRLQTVGHSYQASQQGGSYTQQIRLRPVLPICIVGQGTIGQSLVGPDE